MADETTYYEYNGNPAYVTGGKYRRVLPDGSETRIEELAAFHHEATPITKAEFDERTGRKDAADVPPGTPLFVAHPDDLKTEEQRDALAGHVADRVVDLVNILRKRAGKPPLKD
jgi:hypothetical protein